MQCFVVASCKTIGPTVAVSPAPGKAADAFAEDRRACMASTDAALQPVATRLNLTARRADEVTAGNARIQVMYDGRFGQCMSDRGNAVLASADASKEPQGAAPPAGGEAIYTPTSSGDPTSTEAEQALAPMIARLRRDCEGEDMVPSAREVTLSAQGTARLVALTEPHRGSCFGEPGENDYLIERLGGGWSLLLAAEPGSIPCFPKFASGTLTWSCTAWACASTAVAGTAAATPSSARMIAPFPRPRPPARCLSCYADGARWDIPAIYGLVGQRWGYCSGLPVGPGRLREVRTVEGAGGDQGPLSRRSAALPGHVGRRRRHACAAAIERHHLSQHGVDVPAPPPLRLLGRAGPASETPPNSRCCSRSTTS